MQDIAPLLRSLGFLESEIKVYLAALERGPSTVIDLSSATHLSRPATYTAIEALAERGIMGTLSLGKKRLYTAEHPDRLVQYAKRREGELHARVEDLARLLPELVLRVGGEKPIVKAFEGKEGIQAIIDDIKQTRPRTMEEIANIDALRLVVRPEELAPMRDELQRIGTKIRALYAGDDVTATAITDARLLPPELRGFRGNISIYANKVALVTFVGKFHSVIIEDAAIAGTLRMLFELAWATAKEFPVAEKS